jgi:hypothetical protein
VTITLALWPTINAIATNVVAKNRFSIEGGPKLAINI